jgi:hypothetical protein
LRLGAAREAWRKLLRRLPRRRLEPRFGFLGGRRRDALRRTDLDLRRDPGRFCGNDRAEGKFRLQRTRRVRPVSGELGRSSTIGRALPALSSAQPPVE